MNYRVSFFWDQLGTSVTLWLRQCVIPRSLGIAGIKEGFWVRLNEDDRNGELLWLPAGPGTDKRAQWIPPGRISSVVLTD
jgi:hypothetical protein